MKTDFLGALALSAILTYYVPGGTWSAPAFAQCTGDLDADCRVAGPDLGALLGAWGTDGSAVGADLDGDGTVRGADLGMLLSAWGPCVATPSWATLIEACPD